MRSIDLITSNSGYTQDLTISLSLIIYSDTTSETIAISYGDSSITHQTLNNCEHFS